MATKATVGNASLLDIWTCSNIFTQIGNIRKGVPAIDSINGDI